MNALQNPISVPNPDRLHLNAWRPGLQYPADGTIRFTIRPPRKVEVTLTQFLRRRHGKLFVYVDAIDDESCDVDLDLQQSDDGIAWSSVKTIEPFTIGVHVAPDLVMGACAPTFDPPRGKRTRLTLGFGSSRGRVAVRIWKGER